MEIAITVEANSREINDGTGVNTVVDFIEGMMPGVKVGAEGRTGVKVQQTLRMEIDTVAMQAEMDRVPDPVPLLLGVKVVTDNEELKRELLDLQKPEGDLEAFRKRWDWLIGVAVEAMKVLANQDLPVEELFVIRGDVRAMTSLAFGRKDSGWMGVGQTV